MFLRRLTYYIINNGIVIAIILFYLIIILIMAGEGRALAYGGMKRSVTGRVEKVHRE